MEVTRTIHVKYPTSQYHGADLFCSVKMGAEDLPPESQGWTMDQKAAYLSQWATYYLQSQYIEYYREVEKNLATNYIHKLLPDSIAVHAEQERQKLLQMANVKPKGVNQWQNQAQQNAQQVANLPLR